MITSRQVQASLIFENNRGESGPSELATRKKEAWYAKLVINAAGTIHSAGDMLMTKAAKTMTSAELPIEMQRSANNGWGKEDSMRHRTATSVVLTYRQIRSRKGLFGRMESRFKNTTPTAPNASLGSNYWSGRKGIGECVPSSFEAW